MHSRGFQRATPHAHTTTTTTHTYETTTTTTTTHGDRDRQGQTGTDRDREREKERQDKRRKYQEMRKEERREQRQEKRKDERENEREDQSSKKIPLGRIIPPFFCKSSESDRFSSCLHDSNSMFRAWGINSEWVSREPSLFEMTGYEAIKTTLENARTSALSAAKLVSGVEDSMSGKTKSNDTPDRRKGKTTPPNHPVHQIGTSPSGDGCRRQGRC